jgi:hypothetical protein
MKKYNKLSVILLAILAIALFATACDNAKIEEANKFVDAANKKNDEAKALNTKTGAIYDKVMNGDLENFEEAKKANENELKELIKNYDKIIELLKGSAKDFSEAAKANPNEKFKEYYDASAKAAEKRAEVVGSNKAMVQGFLDSNDLEAFTKTVNDVKAKMEALVKEAGDLQGKVNKLEDEVKALNK